MTLAPAGRAAVVLVLLAVTLLAYAQVAHFAFVAVDDSTNIYANPYVAGGVFAHLAHLWRHPYYGLYIPLTYTTWVGLVALALRLGPHPDPFGLPTSLSPMVFHAAVLILHLANVVLVFAILCRLLRHDIAAGVGAALFAIHPVQTEPVSWASGLKDVEGAFWALLSLWQYVRFAQAMQNGDAPVRARFGRYGLSCIFYVAALLAKPSAAVLPIIAWAIDRWAVGRSARDCTISLAGWLVPLVPLFLVTKYAEGQMTAATAIIYPVAPWQRPLVAGDALAFYLAKLAWPSPLTVDYGRTPQFVLTGPAYFDWIVPLAVAAVVVRAGRRYPTLLAAGAVFLAGVLPVLGLTDFSFQDISTVGDRYLYLSMLGPALALGLLIRRFPTTPALAACAVLLAVGCVDSHVQAGSWHDSVSLSLYTLKVNDKSWLSARNLSFLYKKEGDLALSAQYAALAQQIHPDFQAQDQAPNQNPTTDVDSLRQATAQNPSDSNAHYSLGAQLARQGNLPQAIEEFRTALRLDPNDARAHADLGVALCMQGDVPDGVTELRTALQIQPNYPQAHFNLGAILDQQGQSRQAVAEFQEALREDPTLTQAQAALARAEQRMDGAR